MNAQYGTDEPTETIDTLASPYDLQEETEDMILLKEALFILTKRQQEVIISTIIEELTEHHTAVILGISQPAVHRIKERALDRLRKNYPESNH